MAKTNYMTSDQLIASVKRRASIPTSQSTFTNDDFLAFADEEMSLGLVPSVMTAHSDYFMYTQVIPLVSGQSRYAVPYRAIGNKLREVAYEDGSGQVGSMTQIGIADLSDYNSSSNSRPREFYMENNEVVLVGDFAQAPVDGKLRLTYYMRPNSLVLLEKVAVITNVDRISGIISVSNLPTDFSINSKLDLIKVQSPNKTLVFDITPAAINSTSKTITLNLSDIPSTLAAGDHITMAMECAIPQVPSDLHVVLAHRVAARCLEALGDTEGLQTANAKLAELEVKTNTLISSRVEDAPRKIVNRTTTLRRGRTGRF